MTEPRARRVLLVEDERAARELLAAALRARGLEVVTAGAAGEARALAQEHGYFDAVVTDVVLDERHAGGLELVRELRQAGITAPVVVITAFADLTRLKQALALRVAFLLEKPFSAQELLTVLSQLWEDASELGHFVEQALARLPLTPKEDEVARLVLKGLSNDEIARVLGISDKTVRQHLSVVYQKSGVTSRAEFFHWVFPT